MDRINASMDELRRIVLDAFNNLRDADILQYGSICQEVARVSVNRGLLRAQMPGGAQRLGHLDEELVREVIWDLVIERAVTIGSKGGNDTWPFIRLTEYGRKVAGSVQPTPHDPTGYLRRLRAEIPTVDSVIEAYIIESLETYRINALLSSTIVLGCASEKALLLLIDACANSIQDPARHKKFIEGTQNRNIKRQFDQLNNLLTTNKSKLPNDMGEGLTIELLGVFEMIRKYRNAAGHPIGFTPTREQVYAHLQVFIPYCAWVYKLIDWLSNNAIS